MNGMTDALRRELDDWKKRENERLDKLNSESLDGDVAAKFLRGECEGTCPKCGGEAEAFDSDEGPTRDHWLQRYYTCLECGAEFTEQFRCVPEGIWLTEV